MAGDPGRRVIPGGKYASLAYEGTVVRLDQRARTHGRWITTRKPAGHGVLAPWRTESQGDLAIAAEKVAIAGTSSILITGELPEAALEVAAHRARELQPRDLLLHAKRILHPVLVRLREGERSLPGLSLDDPVHARAGHPHAGGVPYAPRLVLEDRIDLVGPEVAHAPQRVEVVCGVPRRNARRQHNHTAGIAQLGSVSQLGELMLRKPSNCASSPNRSTAPGPSWIS